MLDALVVNGEVGRAVELLSQWKDRVKPNIIMYSTIIKGFATTQQPRRALEAWREMHREGVTANAVVYNAVIDAQARCGCMEVVSALVGDMQKEGVAPDAITYCTIAKGYCVSGDLDKAVEVFRDMERSGLVRDSVVYNTLLDGCIRHSKFALADTLLGEMERSDVAPSNFTLGILVKMYGRRRQLNKAFEAIESLTKRYNFTANSHVRTCLVCACVNNNALGKAREVIREATASPGSVDAKAFNTLLSGYMRGGRLEEAANLVGEAYGLLGKPRALPRGQSIDADALEKLLQAIGQQGLADRVGAPLLERLRVAEAIPISGRHYTLMMGAAVGKGCTRQTN